MQRPLKRIRLLAALSLASVLGLGSASTALAVQPGGITDEAHAMHDPISCHVVFLHCTFRNHRWRIDLCDYSFSTQG